jgi:GT2 family glycosyltransferase
MNPLGLKLRIAIIIPTYKRERELRLCLINLQKELTLIDDQLVSVFVTDDSKDKSFQKTIKHDFPFVSIISGPGKGPATNRNYAVNRTECDWLIFLDDDCLPQIGYLNAFLKQIGKGNYAVLEGKTIPNRAKNRFDETAPVNLTGGKLWSCNFAIKKELFIQVGGFDPNYPTNTMEDIDFKERVLAISKSIFIPEALVVHPWRQRIPFRNLNLRLKSQQHFARKFGLTKQFSFRFQRIKIFLGSIFTNLKELSKFSFKGWTCYIDKMVFNFLMIFI